MFEADQFHHQFIDSRTTPNSLPLLLSFPNSNFHASSSAFSTFDSFSSSSHLHPNFLHQNTNSPKIEHKEEQNHSMLPMNLETQSERDRSVDPWSTDELLTLFRIRSSMENWFPDFTWDHVSRKLAEFGFKKSAEMCKEKYEEESRYLNNMNNTNFPKNYRVFGEFEDLYHSDTNINNNNNNNQNPHQAAASEKNKKLDKAKDNQEEEDKIEQCVEVEEDSKIDQTMLDQNNNSKEEISDKLKSGSKRKRDKCSSSSTSSSSSSFEMFKGFCQDIISTIIAQQEKMHNKLLEDMARRDQEKIAREEEWKKQELDRIDKELQLRAQEQVVAGDRQASIINFLNQFSSNINSTSSYSTTSLVEKSSNSSSTTSSSSLPLLPQNPNPNPPISSSSTIDKDSIFLPPKDIPIKPTSITLPNHCQNPKDSIFLAPKDNPIKPTSILPNDDHQNPNSSSKMDKDPIFLPPKDNPTKPTSKNHDQNPNSSENPNPITVTSNDLQKDDLGKRWPKDEVLALINLRCSLYNSNEEEMINKESAKTVPLWERISKGMFELGYKRSSKRCKEKWENINKYFRKTKDVNKKRSLDSRTCPYFHQLSTLYSQGKLVIASSDLGTDQSAAAAPNKSSTSTSTLVQIDQGEKNPVQASGFEFEF